MPRAARNALGGYCYHVLNRGNGRRTVFRKPRDYEAFLQAARDASEHVPMRVLAACLMPNHFHLVLWPKKDGDLSRWMLRLMNAHVRRYHQHYHSSGHIWRGRFKSFPIQANDHLLAVLRYVERNPLRAKLCKRSADWAWSSVAWRDASEPPLTLAASPVPLPPDWPRRVDAEPDPFELAAIRQSAVRNRPYGTAVWTSRTAKALGLTATLRPRGRPPKKRAQ